MNTTSYIPDIAIHPGETLLEILNEKGMSSKELALRTEKPERTISRVINGKSAITSEMAIAFEKVLDLPATFWMNLQQNYNENLARITYNERCKDAADWARQFPYARMAKFGWVPRTTKAQEKAGHLFDFFKVSSEQAWINSYVSGGLRAAHRLDLAHNTKKQAITAWLRKGELLADKEILPEYDEKKLRAILPDLRKIMAQGKNGFFKELKELCNNAGLCILLVPNLTGAPIHGSSRWLKGVPVVQLSVRYKKYDRFWFTFFHELAHILLHGITYVSLELDHYDAYDKEKEKEANQWAAQWLISDEDFNQLKSLNYKNPTVIKAYSKKVNTHPSVIVGRLQRENLVEYNDINLNRLLTKLHF